MKTIPPTSLKPAWVTAGLRVAVLALVVSQLACSSSVPDPLRRLTQELSSLPEYSVILEDMQISGNFFKSYYHKYKILYAESVATQGDTGAELKTRDRGWVEVSKSFFTAYEGYLGMAILTKSPNDQATRVQQPPGYQYVGDNRYGRWQRDSSGGSFWVFYGQYSLLRDLLGTSTYPIRRGHWDDYRGSYSRGKPYFGSGSKPYYGTKGSITKTRHPSFFERQQLRQSARKSKFSQRVRSRVGRTQSRGRGRFGGK